MIFLILSNSFPAARSRITRSRLEKVSFEAGFRGGCLLESSDLALIVELVVQSTLDARLHIEYQLGARDMLLLWAKGLQIQDWCFSKSNPEPIDVGVVR